ncbi:MAG: hypothetical protein V4667_09665 [Bacteroidota bacterium]
MYKELLKFQKDNNLDSNTSYFDCKGNPTECKVFLVGYTPSKELNTTTNFWNYFKEDNLFRFDEWMADYKKDVSPKYKNGLKPTRKRIETLRSNLEKAKINLLNCTIFVSPSLKKEDLKSKYKQVEILDLLLNEIHPSFLILQGTDTQQYFSAKYVKDSPKFKEWKVYEVTLNDTKIKILPVPHLFDLAMSAQQNPTENIEVLSKLISSNL